MRQSTDEDRFSTNQAGVTAYSVNTTAKISYIQGYLNSEVRTRDSVCPELMNDHRVEGTESRRCRSYCGERAGAAAVTAVKMEGTADI